MVSDKTVKLILSLYKKTTDRAVKWRESPIDGNFNLGISSYSLTISITDTSHKRPIYTLTISDIMGRTIDEIDSTELDDVLDDGYDFLRTIYEIARSQALGIEEALDKIITELDDGEPF